MIDIIIGANGSGFRTGLAQCKAQAKQFGGDIKGMLVGAFSIGAIMSFAEKMREVHKEALRFGTDAETIQRIGKAAKLADVDFDTLARSMNKVTLEATKAARGGEEQSRTFKLLGIDAARFVTLGMDQKVLVLAEAFKRSRSSGMETAAMLELLGERGSEITPLLAQGPEVISKTMQDATVQTNSTVEAMTQLSKQMGKIQGLGARFLGGAIAKAEKFAKGLALRAATASSPSAA